MDFAALPTLTEAQAIERFELHRYFDWMRLPRYKPNAKDRWCVAEGDHVIEGDLRLAWKVLPCAGLIVTGSLTVGGSIVSVGGGPKLVVLRDTRAHALFTTGGEIAISGTARFADVVVAQYPKGHLHLARLEAPMMINDDHSVTLGGGRYGYYNSRQAQHDTTHPADYRCWSQFLDPGAEDRHRRSR
jgi:hypothetical protein